MKNTNLSKLTILLIITIIALLFLVLFGINKNNFLFFIGSRLNKITAICLSGVCISVSSLIFQTITGSKILTPSIMGLDYMYVFLQTSIIFFFSSSIAYLSNDIVKYFLSLFCMIGISLLLQKFIVPKNNNNNILNLVLIGIIFGTFLDSLSDAMSLALDPNEFLILQGSLFENFSNVNPIILIISAILAACTFIFIIDDTNNLDVLSLGYTYSINLGLNYNKIIKKILICSAILISISTALVGPMTFLGLLSVNISRQLLKTYKHSSLIISSILVSILAIIIGQIISIYIFNNSVASSIIINFIGGLYLLISLTKRRSVQ